jgi:predicted RNA-binding Zn ribbon-like protein
MVPSEPSPITSLRLVGGNPALDFVNTVTKRFTDRPIDFLPDFACLMAWGLHSGVLDEEEHAAGIRAGQHAHTAVRVCARALRLREALFRSFSDRVDGLDLSDDAVEVLNRELARAAQTWRLVGDGGAVRWHWPVGDPALVLARLAVASAELLTREESTLVRRCAGAEHGCAWLFVDHSRGGRRRWCSMEVCGNRAKARVHYNSVRAT